MTAALLLIAQSAADEHSTAYDIGRVVGTVLVVAVLLGGVYWLGMKVLGGKRQPARVSPPGWYPDPEGGSGRRWWDGEGWTEERQEP